MASQAPQAPNGAPAATVAKPGPIDNRDVDDWKNRFNEVLAKPGDVINSSAPADAREYQSSFFGCFNPIDTCLITWCLPCITFGKTHHRSHKHGNMEGYEPINTSCLLFLASACFGLHWIPQSMQRAEIRRKYHLQGSCVTDIAAACCCALCDLVQQDKEAELREKELGSSNGAVTAQYEGESMVYAPKT